MVVGINRHPAVWVGDLGQAVEVVVGVLGRALAVEDGDLVPGAVIGVIVGVDDGSVGLLVGESVELAVGVVGVLLVGAALP